MASLSAVLISVLKLSGLSKMNKQNSNLVTCITGINKDTDFLEIFTAVHEIKRGQTMLSMDKLVKNESYLKKLKKDITYENFWRDFASLTSNLLIEIQKKSMNNNSLLYSHILSKHDKEVCDLVKKMSDILISNLSKLLKDINICTVRLPDYLKERAHNPHTLYNFHRVIFLSKDNTNTYHSLMNAAYPTAIRKAINSDTNLNLTQLKHELLNKLDINYNELAYYTATIKKENDDNNNNNIIKQLIDPNFKFMNQPNPQILNKLFGFNNRGGFNRNNFGRGRGRFTPRGRYGYNQRGRGRGYQNRNNRNNPNNETREWIDICKKYYVPHDGKNVNGKKFCRLFNQDKQCNANECNFFHGCVRCSQTTHSLLKCPLNQPQQ